MFELNNMNKQMKNHSVIVSLCLLIYPIDIGIIILPKMAGWLCEFLTNPLHPLLLLLSLKPYTCNRQIRSVTETRNKHSLFGLSECKN